MKKRNPFERALTVTALLLFAFAGQMRAQVPVALAPSVHLQFVDSTGRVLSGGFIYTYSAGTTTRLDTFTDNTGSIANAWPIPLDATGAPSNGSTQTGIWLSNNAYKICAYNSSMVQQWCTDNVSAYQILNNIQNIVFGSVTSDPTGAAGMVGYRSDIPCFRGYTTFWDCFVTLTGIQTLTNKTIDETVNTIKTVTNSAGHYLRNNGSKYTDGAIQGIDLPPQYRQFECAPGLGDGLNAISAGTYLQFNCVNKSAVTWTIVSINCWTDNNGTSTLRAQNNAGTDIIAGPTVTCNNTKVAGGAGAPLSIQTLASGDAISFTFVADGTTKQATWTVTLTQ